MSSAALVNPRRALRVRAAVIGTIGLGLLNGALLAGALLPTGGPADDDFVLRTSSEAAPAGTIDAIGSWMDSAGQELPAGYAGECSSGVGAGVVCSSLVDDLGGLQVHRVGVSATDWGVDVLLKQTGSTWQVADAAPWPDLGDRYDGPPWSPMTAITAWWTDDDRAGSMYGAGTVHLPSCDEAAGNDDEPLLCSTLVQDDGAIRVYDTGRVGAPPDVRVTVVQQPDGTWAVTDTLVH